MYGSRRRSSTPLMGQLDKRRQRNSRAPLTGTGPDARDSMRANRRSSQHALLERSDGPRHSANRQFPAEQPRMQTFVAEAPTPISRRHSICPEYRLLEINVLLLPRKAQKMYRTIRIRGRETQSHIDSLSRSAAMQLQTVHPNFVAAFPSNRFDSAANAHRYCAESQVNSLQQWQDPALLDRNRPVPQK